MGKNIYKNRDSYFLMLKPVGHCTIRGYEHYALWLRMKKCKFLGFTFFWKYGQQEFYLDMYGFEKLP